MFDFEFDKIVSEIRGKKVKEMLKIDLLVTGLLLLLFPILLFVFIRTLKFALIVLAIIFVIIVLFDISTSIYLLCYYFSKVELKHLNIVDINKSRMIVLSKNVWCKVENNGIIDLLWSERNVDCIVIGNKIVAIYKK